MKRTLIILTLLAGPALALEQAVPAAFPAERYAPITDKSPFALATPAVPPPPPPQASFAANWYITGLGRDPEGRDFVTIKAQDGSVHFSLMGSDPDPENGVALASVDWSDTMRKSTAIIKKGTETAKLIFSQEEAAAAPQPRAGRGGPPGGAPPVPLPPVTAPPPPVIGGAGVGGGNPAQPQPGQSRGFLPRPGSAPLTNQPPPPVVAPAVVGTPPSTAPSSDPGNRRRIRTIGAPQ